MKKYFQERSEEIRVIDQKEITNCFIKCCQDNKVEKLEECLSLGVDVNTVSGCLMDACNHGNPAIVSRLVQVPRLDINYQDEYGNTAALMASWKGRTECVRILAETG